MSIFFGWSLSLTAILLIIIVLIQRGRGGGLAGALGGAGGQSAFGTKAGDLFTKITMGLAAFWIIFCIFALWCLTPSNSSKFSSGSEEEQRGPAKPGEKLATPLGTKATGTSATSGATSTSTGGTVAPAAPAGTKSAAPMGPAAK